MARRWKPKQQLVKPLTFSKRKASGPLWAIFMAQAHWTDKHSSLPNKAQMPHIFNLLRKEGETSFFHSKVSNTSEQKWNTTEEEVHLPAAEKVSHSSELVKIVWRCSHEQKPILLTNSRSRDGTRAILCFQGCKKKQQVRTQSKLETSLAQEKSDHFISSSDCKQLGVLGLIQLQMLGCETSDRLDQLCLLWLPLKDKLRAPGLGALGGLGGGSTAPHKGSWG